jgi:phosphohistidine swiveling domain-containing protein
MFVADVFPDAMMAGFKAGTHKYCVLLDHLEVAVINRFFYFAPRPVGAPKSAKGAPPRLLFEIMRRVHPEIRRRVAGAESVFRDRVWRQDVDMWDRELRPRMAEEARALLAEDLARATDAQLADHVRRAADLLRTATFNHHRLNFCALLAVGDFLLSAMEWTGMPPGELLQTMRGLSPVSAGALDELKAFRQGVLETPDALSLLRSGMPEGDILAQLQARSDKVGAAARAFVGVVGMRVLGGYDVSDRHAIDHPEMIVKVMRASLAGEDENRLEAAARTRAKIRDRVPAAHRAKFDELLAEAQLVYRVREERVFHGDMLAVGIARRAILAAGQRLVHHARAHDAQHLVDATPNEIVSLLEGRPGPSADELAARFRWREETPISAAPANLGFPPSPPPPPEWLPGAAGQLQKITALIMSLLFDVHKPGGSEGMPGTAEGAPDEVQPHQPVRDVHHVQAPLKGFAVSAGVYEGPVRLIRGIEELPLVQKGDVLVAWSTGSAFNVVLPLIGALVTERGGVLSHAAIVSREYGLPGIVGCVGAATKLKTGIRVRVDGDKGEVWTIA